MNRPPRRAHTFIIRLWVEPREVVGSQEWRGEIQHVPSGRRTHFRRLETLGEVVERMVAEAEVP